MLVHFNWIDDRKFGVRCLVKCSSAAWIDERLSQKFMTSFQRTIENWQPCTEFETRIMLQKLYGYLNIFSRSMIDMTLIVNMFDILDKKFNMCSSLLKYLDIVQMLRRPAIMLGINWMMNVKLVSSRIFWFNHFFSHMLKMQMTWKIINKISLSSSRSIDLCSAWNSRIFSLDYSFY